ncbi:MAG: hypothetical protein Q9204_007498 [Flavoplaca sp. TL-2023a]
MTWTKKDDDCSDGLCAPFLALAYVGNYHVFDVDALSDEAQKNANSQTRCKGPRMTPDMPLAHAASMSFSNQKINPAGDPATDPEAHCRLDITIYDNNQDKIGEVLGAEAPAGKAVNVYSKLPFVLLVTAQEDADPVLFDYADQHWVYADVAHACNFGQYDAGDREEDCGFSC